ncbi:unknown [Clostridium sp. CAG:1219]|nr:unknown [Clostridium sp. CAG:1219]
MVDNNDNINCCNNLFMSSFVISIILAKDLSSVEQNLLGNYLQIIGQNLTSLSTFSEILDNNLNTENNQ